MKKFFISGLFSIFFISSNSFALGDIRPMFALLKNSSVDYGIVGAVCEQVTKVLMQRQYPAQTFTVLTGVEYARQQGGSTIGELDVIVVRNADQKILLVGEVKCWKDLKGARAKAKDQRERIIRTLQSGQNLKMQCTDRTCQFTNKNFDQVQRFIGISQAGGRQFGFDIDLPYSLEQLMGLRQELMKCQNLGQCPRPIKH